MHSTTREDDIFVADLGLLGVVFFFFIIQSYTAKSYFHVHNYERIGAEKCKLLFENSQYDINLM